MKLSLALLATAAASASAFNPVAFKPRGTTAITRSSVILAGSKAAEKKASRSEWAKARGMTDGSAKGETVEAGLLTNADGLEYVKLSVVAPESWPVSL